MSAQESQKRGARSEAQKQQRARHGYNPIPPARPVGGASGEHTPEKSSDEDVSLRLNEKTQRRTHAKGE
jgi:hypothetical protein